MAEHINSILCTYLFACRSAFGMNEMIICVQTNSFVYGRWNWMFCLEIFYRWALNTEPTHIHLNLYLWHSVVDCCWIYTYILHSLYFYVSGENPFHFYFIIQMTNRMTILNSLVDDRKCWNGSFIECIKCWIWMLSKWIFTLCFRP